MLKILLKKQLAAFFSSMVVGRGAKANKKPSVGIIILIAFLMLYLFGAILMMMIGLSVSTCQVLTDNGYAWFYFAMPFGLCFLISVFFGIFSSQAQIFNARDNELLLAMPIKPRDILLSRLFMMMAPDYFLEIFIVAVFGIVYAMFYGATFIGTLLLCLLIIVMPLLAVAIYSLLGWVISLITARIKRKQLVSSVISIAFVILYFTAYSRFMEMMNGIEEGTEVIGILGVFAPFADNLAKYVPPLKWIGLSIAEHSALNTLFSLAITIIPFAVVIWLISRSFIGIVTTKRGGKKNVYKTDGSVKTASMGKALYLRELKRTLNCSIYLINAGLGAVMAIVVSVMLVSQGDLQGLRDAIELEMPALSGIVPFGAAVLVCLISSTITFTASAISLEGRYLWIVKTLPIDTKKLLMSKVMLQMTFAIPAALIASGIMCIVVRPTWLEIIPYFLLPLVFNLLAALFGLIMNLRFPKFDWINEAQPVKQGLSAFLGMFVPAVGTIIIGGGIGVASVVITFICGYGWVMTVGMLVLTLVFAMMSLILYNVLKKWGVRRFERL